MKRRLLHLVPLDTLGGVERLYSSFIRATKGQFDHVTVNDRKSIAPLLRDEITEASCAIYSTRAHGYMPIPRRPVCLRTRYFGWVLSKESPDLVVVWNKLEGFDLTLLPTGTPVVYYEHGAGWYSAQPEACQEFLGRVDSIVCNSKAAMAVVKYKWVLPDTTPFELCYNPVRKECLIGAPAGRLFPEGRPVVLGMAGRMLSRKGIPVALHAVARLIARKEDFRLKLAGTGPEERAFRLLADQLGILGRVEFCGLVSDMMLFYASIDIFLCPSVTEPFGLVAAEAAAQGVPVIASAVDGLQEVVLDGKTGLLVEPSMSLSDYTSLGGEPERLLDVTYQRDKGGVVEPRVVSPEALVEAVSRLASDKVLYESVSLHAARDVRERFSQEGYVQRLNELFLAACR